MAELWFLIQLGTRDPKTSALFTGLHEEELKKQMLPCCLGLL